jgi:hypothetical protein
LKVSITNKHIRWTVKSTSGIKDLDSETELVADSLYNVTVLYDGSDFEIYINGELDAFTSFSGLILTTPIDFMIGQVLPGNNQYNFNGVLDDIRIYNYALSYLSIQDLYDFSTGLKDPKEIKMPQDYSLSQNYPNPFNSQTIISYQIKNTGKVRLEIYDALGTRIRSLLNEIRNRGYYSQTWDGKDNRGKSVSSGVYFYRLNAGDFIETKKMILLR